MTSNTLRHKENREKKRPWKWADIPTRKPLAVGSAFFVALVVLWHTVHGTDVPPGTAGLLEALIYACVGSYAATSAYEAVRTPRRRQFQEAEEKEGDEEE